MEHTTHTGGTPRRALIVWGGWDGHEPEQVAQFGQQSPMQHPAQPVELAPAYVYLASQESSYVSAQTIGVTGGTPLF